MGMMKEGLKGQRLLRIAWRIIIVGLSVLLC